MNYQLKESLTETGTLFLLILGAAFIAVKLFGGLGLLAFILLFLL